MPLKLRKRVDHMATGADARNARKRAGKSLLDVASRLGCSIPYVSDLELGKRGWTEERLRRFEKALN